MSVNSTKSIHRSCCFSNRELVSPCFPLQITLMTSDFRCTFWTSYSDWTTLLVSDTCVEVTGASGLDHINCQLGSAQYTTIHLSFKTGAVHHSFQLPKYKTGSVMVSWCSTKYI